MPKSKLEGGRCLIVIGTEGRARLSPRIYRDIEIESTRSLYDLAAAIVQTFGFDFGFFSNLGDYVFDSAAGFTHEISFANLG
jgi:hypothetical protein